MRVLRSAKELREKLSSLFADRVDERIAIVAFVGAGANEFLPQPQGIRLFCNPSIPGTNPAELRRLLRLGVEVNLVRDLHMKVYWSKKKGAIVGSANLTRNAFIENGLAELAVLLPPSKINVSKIIATLVYTQANKKMLAKLEREYNAAYKIKGRPRKSPGAGQQTFVEWYKSRLGPPFKIYFWDEERDPPKDTERQVRAETGTDNYQDYIHASSTNAYRQGEWVLGAKNELEGGYVVEISELEWFVPQVRVQTSDKRWPYGPHIWFQVTKRLPPIRPFNEKDPVFMKAFARAYQDVGFNSDKAVVSANRPAESFLKRVARLYEDLSG